MMDELKRMMAKKKSPEGKMSEDQVKAKMDVIQELLEMAQSAMGSNVKGGMDEMKKVSVMAPDDEGLAEGLELAKEVAVDDESPEHEASEEAEEAALPGEESADEALSMFNVDKKEDEDEDEMPNIFAQRREKNKRV